MSVCVCVCVAVYLYLRTHIAVQHIGGFTVVRWASCCIGALVDWLTLQLRMKMYIHMYMLVCLYANMFTYIYIFMPHKAIWPMFACSQVVAVPQNVACASIEISIHSVACHQLLVVQPEWATLLFGWPSHRALPLHFTYIPSYTLLQLIWLNMVMK